MKELANNGGEMDQGELERRFNEYWGVEETVKTKPKADIIYSMVIYLLVLE